MDDEKLEDAGCSEEFRRDVRLDSMLPVRCADSTEGGDDGVSIDDVEVNVR